MNELSKRQFSKRQHTPDRYKRSRSSLSKRPAPAQHVCVRVCAKESVSEDMDCSPMTVHAHAYFIVVYSRFRVRTVALASVGYPDQQAQTAHGQERKPGILAPARRVHAPEQAGDDVAGELLTRWPISGQCRVRRNLIQHRVERAFVLRLSSAHGCIVGGASVKPYSLGRLMMLRTMCCPPPRRELLVRSLMGFINRLIDAQLSDSRGIQ